MFDIQFWVGFCVGATVVVALSVSIAIWFIIQAANFHDSWLSKKEKE